MGFPLAEVDGHARRRRSTSRRKDKVDFYFKCSPSPDGKGFDTEPALVHCRRHEEARDGRAIDGTLTLHDSPLDPIADIPVGKIVSMQFAQVATTQHGEVVERVPADWLLPVRAPALRRPLGAREEGLTCMSDERYTIISADAHAGLPCEEYRPYLDARYHAAFDEFLAERQANRDEQMKLNYDYITQLGDRRTKKACAARSTPSSATRRWTPTASPPR